MSFLRSASYSLADSDPHLFILHTLCFVKLVDWWCDGWKKYFLTVFVRIVVHCMWAILEKSWENCHLGTLGWNVQGKDILWWLAVLPTGKTLKACDRTHSYNHNDVMGPGECDFGGILSNYISDIAWITTENAPIRCLDGMWWTWKVSFVFVACVLAANANFTHYWPWGPLHSM